MLVRESSPTTHTRRERECLRETKRYRFVSGETDFPCEGETVAEREMVSELTDPEKEPVAQEMRQKHTLLKRISSKLRGIVGAEAASSPNST